MWNDNRKGKYGGGNNNYGGTNNRNDRRNQDYNKNRDGQNGNDDKKLPEKFSEVFKNGNLDLDVIDEVMVAYMNSKDAKITTSKLRNIMSMISEIYNFESRRREETLDQGSISKLQRLHIRIVYEYGRTETNKEFKPFCNRFRVLEYLTEISRNHYKRSDFINYAKFFEALVAYHRYRGGRD